LEATHTHRNFGQERLEKAVRSAINDAKTKPGWLVPNGATLLAQFQVGEQPHGVDYIVLCVTTGHTPFVTWRRFIGAEQLADGHSYGPLDYCWSGNYHRTLEAAIADYRERIGGDRDPIV
jgi:hypothetical protein